MLNIKGNQVFGSTLKPLHTVELDAYLVILIIAGVIKSNGGTLKNLRNENFGRPIFMSTMSLKRIMATSTILRFDSAEDRVERCQRN